MEQVNELVCIIRIFFLFLQSVKIERLACDGEEDKLLGDDFLGHLRRQISLDNCPGKELRISAA